VLVAFVTTYFDLYRVLDEAQQEVLLRLTPGSSEDSRAVWGTLLAQTYAIQGDRARARVYADSRDVRSICDIGRRPPRSGDKRTIQRRGKVFRAPFEVTCPDAAGDPGARQPCPDLGRSLGVTLTVTIPAGAS
jgi:hypothetical protein